MAADICIQKGSLYEQYQRYLLKMTLQARYNSKKSWDNTNYDASC